MVPSLNFCIYVVVLYVPEDTPQVTQEKYKHQPSHNKPFDLLLPTKYAREWWHKVNGSNQPMSYSRRWNAYLPLSGWKNQRLINLETKSKTPCLKRKKNSVVIIMTFNYWFLMIFWHIHRLVTYSVTVRKASPWSR